VETVGSLVGVLPHVMTAAMHHHGGEMTAAIPGSQMAAKTAVVPTGAKTTVKTKLWPAGETKIRISSKTPKMQWKMRNVLSRKPEQRGMQQRGLSRRSRTLVAKKLMIRCEQRRIS